MAEPGETIVVERQGPVTTVVLNRPQVRNALDIASSQALAEAFFAFERDASARVAVLWGAAHGGEAFYDKHRMRLVRMFLDKYLNAQ